jgi:hypothetical protein
MGVTEMVLGEHHDIARACRPQPKTGERLPLARASSDPSEPRGASRLSCDPGSFVSLGETLRSSPHPPQSQQEKFFARREDFAT